MTLRKLRKGLGVTARVRSNDVLVNLEENNADGKNLLLVLVLVPSVNCQES